MLSLAYYLRCRWAVALDSTSIHIGHRGRFSGPGHHCSGVWSAESAGTTQPLPDQSQIKQGGPSFSQALSLEEMSLTAVFHDKMGTASGARSCHRADAAEGAGVIVRKFAEMTTRSLPKRLPPS